MKLIQVVRRYGPVGGMERYVWELTHELRNLGHEVLVLCETCLADKSEGIIVHELGTVLPRPRWLALLRFGRNVANWLAQNPHPDWLIHSHERLASHHITTFHGPPFASVRDQPWWRKISLRVVMQFYLERRELETAKVIVANSIFIRSRLAHYYPEFSHKLTAPVVPGVAAMQTRGMRNVPVDGGIVGFVGKEWQRKGLPLAVRIIEMLRRNRPQIQLWVAGSEADEIKHLFAGWQGGFRLLGWSDQAHYAEYDVLLHPARAEPYGMVISEAMAACVPVVISDVCGAAAQVTKEAGTILPLTAPVEAWADALEEQLTRRTAPPQFLRGWDVVAREYETIYRNYLAK